MNKRKTPIMGWASWNCFRTGITEEKIKEQAELLVKTGLAEHGYTYVNIDDGFFGGRDRNGNIIANAERFPNGMGIVADYIHRLGLKAGIYADGGDNTCGYYYDNEGKNGEKVGLYGHEEQDLRKYLLEWDYDFIKVDWCGGLRLGLDEEEQYGKIGRIIKRLEEEKDREIIYNVCRWQFPGEWVAKTASSWRVGSDIAPDFVSCMHQLDMARPLRKYCSPGHFNDLDMLQIGNGMTKTEDAAHFAMWCMAATPLMIGCDLTRISQDTLEILTNDELIAIHQDEACQQGFVAKEQYENGKLQAQIWVKDLEREHSPVKAAAFLNRDTKRVSIRATLNELGLGRTPGDVLEVRDVGSHRNLAISDEWEVILEPHECKVFKVRASCALDLEDHTEAIRLDDMEKISWEKALKLAGEGAVLIDVRTVQEFASGHEEGAVSVPYMDIHAEAPTVLPDKNRALVTYCGTGKRSSQAAKSLKCLGYQKVYYTVVS